MTKKKETAAVQPPADGAGTPPTAAAPTHDAPQATEAAVAHYGTLQRSVTLQRADQPVGEDGLLEFTFSSETPAKNWYPGEGVVEETLDHSPESVLLDRLNAGGTILREVPGSGNPHDAQLVGRVVRAWTGADRRNHVQARLSTTPAAMEERTLINDGTRSNVSARYEVHKIRIERPQTPGEGLPKVRAMLWEPVHILLCNDPVDYTVGIGRSKPHGQADAIETQVEEVGAARRAAAPAETETQEGVTVEKQFNQPDAASQESGGAAVADSGPTREDMRKAEAKRIERCRGIAKRFGAGHDMLQRAISEGFEPEQLMDEIIAQAPAGQPVTETGGEIGMSKKEVESWSLMRAIRYLANPKDIRAREDAGLEIEASQAFESMGFDAPRGLYMPREVQVHQRAPLPAALVDKLQHKEAVQTMVQRAMMQRAPLTAGGSAGTGPETVATDLLAGSFIDVLRNASIMLQRCTVLDNLQDNVDLPRRSAASDPSDVATEGGDGGESPGSFDQVQLRPHTAAVWLEITAQLLRQSSISVENFLRTDLALGIGGKISYNAIQADGTGGACTGYLNVSGIGDVTSSGTMTWANIVELWTDVAGASALASGSAFHAQASVIGKLLTTPKVSGYPQYLADSPSSMLGHDIVLDNMVPNDTLGFLNFLQILIGLWGPVDLFADRQAKSGNVILTALQIYDAQMRQEKAASAIQDITP